MTEPKDILQQYWGYPDFRPGQEAIVRSALKGNDTLALLPTGGGKSICFQVPGIMRPGLCLVISPLIALMKDQVENLKNVGVEAAAIFSGMSFKDQNTLLSKAVEGKLQFLYLSPERLGSKDFNGWLRNMDVGLIAVDEAHCISQWGYDFRPEYLKIADVRTLFPQTPILALTASATPIVVKDIMQNLAFTSTEHVFKKSFARENLTYKVVKAENKKKVIAEKIKARKGSGLVYLRNRRGTEEMAMHLVQHGINADFYHAGLSMETRNTKQAEWIAGKTQVMVCTNAFGMGIDKPDVRFVFHFEPPDCPESYYQEAGRAGRDLKQSECILVYREQDLSNEKNKIKDQYPENPFLNHVYQALCNHLGILEGTGKGLQQPFALETFCKAYTLPVLKTWNALKILHKQEYLMWTDAGNTQSTLKINLTEYELYAQQVKDPFINELFLSILRNRGGYFDYETPIDEKKIALSLQIPIVHLKAKLVEINKKGWIRYQPKSNTPQIVLLQPRMAEINPDRKSIDFLKKRALERFDAMCQYITQVKTCRNQWISLYFGDNTSKPCNTCDVCNGIAMQSSTDDDIPQQHQFNTIKEYLHSNSSTLSEITNLFGEEDIPSLGKTLNWMAKNNWITKNKQGIISWKEKK